MRISEASRKLSVPRHRIEYWKKTGLLVAGNQELSFPDLVRIRFLTSCRTKGIPLQRLRKAFHREQTKVFNGSLDAIPGLLLIRQDDLFLEPATGQYALPFGEERPAPSTHVKEWELQSLEREYEQSQGKQQGVILNKILEVDPNHVGARIELGNILFDKEKYDQALKEYSRVLEVDNESVEAHYNIANIYIRQRKLAAAIRTLQKCIDIDNDFPEAYYNLGIIYYSIKNLQSANAMFEYYLKLDGDSDWAIKAKQFQDEVSQLMSLEEGGLFD